MEFFQYLTMRHLIVKNAKVIGPTSANQYISRLNNLILKGMYQPNQPMDEQISEAINKEYVNKAGEYERTLKYYLEYVEFMK